VIFKEITAESFMRFHEVKLLNLPQEGLVCISGANESGKSTIRHLIYYILSGKNSSGNNVADLINWESGQMRVAATFTHNDKNIEIYRQADRDGSTFSKLTVDGDVYAQGNKELDTAFTKLMGYSADQLGHSYLVDHKVLSGCVKGNTDEHIIMMSGLNPIKEAHKRAIEGAEKITQALTSLKEQCSSLEQEKINLGYDANLENQYGEEKKGLDASIAEKAQALKEKHDHMEKVQSHISHVEKEVKHIPTKFEGDVLEVYESECPSILMRLEKMELGENSAKALKEYCEIQEKVIHFFTERKKFFSKIEDTLSTMRRNLGIEKNDSDQSGQETIHARELNFKRKSVVQKRQLKFWLTTTLLVVFCAQ
jgi:DNA repair exonuclease SbcCD ATPase subunit